MNEMDFYSLTMVFGGEGKQLKEVEDYINLSLNDFEVIYGNENRKVVEMKLWKQEKFIGCCK